MPSTALHTGLLALALVAAAAATAALHGRGAGPTPPADKMQVVKLPTVYVTAKRQVAAGTLVAEAPLVVQLPLVTVVGRRMPAMEPVALAVAQP